MFQRLKDWWDRRSALREVRATDKKQSDGFGKYFSEQMVVAKKSHSQGNADQARIILSRLRGQFPELAKTSKGVCELLIDLGSFDEAEALIQEGYKRYPDIAHFARSYILVAHRRGNVSEALQRCETVRKKYPHMAECYAVAASCLEDQGRVSEAEAVTARGIEMTQDRPSFIFSMRVTLPDAASGRRRSPDGRLSSPNSGKTLVDH